MVQPVLETAWQFLIQWKNIYSDLALAFLGAYPRKIKTCMLWDFRGMFIGDCLYYPSTENSSCHFINSKTNYVISCSEMSFCMKRITHAHRNMWISIHMLIERRWKITDLKALLFFMKLRNRWNDPWHYKENNESISYRCKLAGRENNKTILV